MSPGGDRVIYIPLVFSGLDLYLEDSEQYLIVADTFQGSCLVFHSARFRSAASPPGSADEELVWTRCTPSRCRVLARVSWPAQRAPKVKKIEPVSRGTPSHLFALQSRLAGSVKAGQCTGVLIAYHYEEYSYCMTWRLCWVGDTWCCIEK